MLGEMLCNTGGSQRMEQAGRLWHKESQRGHYDRATPGLQGLKRTSQTEPRVSNVGHSAKLNPSFNMTSQNGILDSISPAFCPLCFCQFQETAAKGVRRKQRLFDGSRCKLHNEMGHNHIEGDARGKKMHVSYNSYQCISLDRESFM